MKWQNGCLALLMVIMMASGVYGEGEAPLPETPAVAAPAAEVPATDAPMTIQDGKSVKINLILTVDGTEMMNTAEHEPVAYVHGKEEILPALEKELTGLKVGDVKDVVVSADNGFGQINPEAVMEFPKDKLPEGEIAKDMQVELIDPTGNRVPARVIEIKDTVVVLDVNHPLAGKELHFKATVLEIA